MVKSSLLGLVFALGMLFFAHQSDSSLHGGFQRGRLLYLPSAPILHYLSLGEDFTAADLLFLRGVFYIAETGVHDTFEEHLEKVMKEGERDRVADSIAAVNLDFRNHSLLKHLFFWNQEGEVGRDLYPLLDRVTDLDPRFEPAYTSGALMIAMFMGRPQEALALTEKGVKNLPHKWGPYYYRGFIRLFYYRDLQGAAEDFTQAALKPDAPPFLSRIARGLQVKVRGSDLATAYLLALAETSDDPIVKERVWEILMSSGLEGHPTLTLPHFHSEEGHHH